MKSTLYFKHDLYAIENDSELRYVCSEYPVWGEAVFFKAVSFLYRSNGNEYNKKILVMDVAHGLFTDNKEKVEEIINLCIELGLFKVTDDGKVFSSRVNEACQRQASFNEKQRERINKRWGKDTETVPNENQNDTNGIPTEYQRNTERNTNKQEQEQDKNNPLSVSNETSSPLSEKDIEMILIWDENKQCQCLTEQGTVCERRASYLIGGHRYCNQHSKIFASKVINGGIPYSEIQEAWNKCCQKSGLPKCTKISDKRRNSIRALWTEFGEVIYTAIQKVSDSDFLSGRDGKWNGCGFDWLFIKNNMLKVLEGNYDNKQKPVNGSYGNNKTVRPKDITGRYDDLESEVIEV